jgi:AGCS family alanine or glycine:cation symporter
MSYRRIALLLLFSGVLSVSLSSTVSAAEDGAKPDTKPGLMSRLESRVDGVAEWCVGKLASVMFYEILAREEFSTDSAGSLTEIDEIGSLVEKAGEAGLQLNEVNFSLSLPPGSLTKKQAKELTKALNKRFTAERTRKFSVEVRKKGKDDDPATQGKTLFKAVSPGIPIVVLWLVLGAVFFTLRMGFINFRGFKHAILVTAGKYDDPDNKDEGEVSHFQALTAALSATVGLGNIAGVAIAVMAGGPGATFWMIMAGLLGMSSKFVECTLGQKYRQVRPDGRVMGGAMFYLSRGLEEMNLGKLGAFLGGLFAVLCVLASFGGGNAFQVNQSLKALQETVPFLADNGWVYGLVMAGLVGIVIIGGIQRIAATAEKIVPLMCGVYVLACLWILLKNFTGIPAAFSLIFSEAFTPQAGYGGFLGVLIMGFKRAAFSNEAGVGSAAIAHSAAKTEYPVREGIVALLEPFIDTVVICTMTALVIVITGAYANPEYSRFVAENNGAGLTSNAMAEEISWFPYILSVAVVMFAYSTMISWSYYGERCWAYLFGDRASMAYRLLFVGFVFLGSIVSATNILDLSDLMILGMAFPNILGVLLLSGKVKRDLDDYWAKLKSGEIKRTK